MLLRLAYFNRRYKAMRNNSSFAYICRYFRYHCCDLYYFRKEEKEKNFVHICIRYKEAVPFTIGYYKGNIHNTYTCIYYLFA